MCVLARSAFLLPRHCAADAGGAKTEHPASFLSALLSSSLFALPLASSPPFDTGSLRDTDPAAPPTEQITMYDYLKVPAHLSPGEYVLGVSREQRTGVAVLCRHNRRVREHHKTFCDPTANFVTRQVRIARVLVPSFLLHACGVDMHHKNVGIVLELEEFV